MSGEKGKSVVDFELDLADDIHPDDEGLFARNIDGQLIRLERATASQLDENVTLIIDGREVTVKRAMPECDSQGKIKVDADGTPVPRPTTIYDATSEAFVVKPGDAHPIPALCHREHLPPVGVCRVCVVEVAEMSRGVLRRKLVPSCKQVISDGMIVNTINSQVDADAANRVKNASRTVVELLLADHLPAEQKEASGNELYAIAKRLDAKEDRFHSAEPQRGKDSSSHMISVDHDQCILCGRCQRGCNWVKQNNVIGRGGKGYDSRIVFDLDLPMAESSCVSCGECAVSCPTGALEFQKPYLEQRVELVKQDKGEGDIVTADELITYPIFSGIPYKFLQFNGGAVLRRTLDAGDVLCKEGEYGSTAFIILDGEFEVFLNSERGKVVNKNASRLFGGFKSVLEKVGGMAVLGDAGNATLEEDERILMTAEDTILGEMTCMNRYPRSATVVATQSSTVLEIQRNVLFMLQRNAVSREILDNVYRKRSLMGQLEGLPIFAALDKNAKEQAAAFLADKADLVFVDPMQPIFKQDDVADDYYVIKLGFVKVSQRYGQGERVLDYLSPGRGFGEIGLLSGFGNVLQHEFNNGQRRGTRTATCSALDHVELYRIRGEHFRDLLNSYPDLIPPLVSYAENLLDQNAASERRLAQIDTEDFLEQGLYLAQSLLVLDLERCTRCDECTKACSDTHSGVTRLIREGLRFDKFLVASSCRSCLDPLCLVGCPVDAIHRNGSSLEIEIEDYCIGCGLCSSNCPYGNINMHGFPSADASSKATVVQQRATTCDLCKDAGGPSCVHACPHDAAFRMSGEELMKIVER